ncbi:hypothetical protein, partial [Streptococcus ferus]|uniref:hypothetical protein n=1 Tax=Streptococcus ferus TaxID=1345 RepID=UPI00359F6318
NPVLRIAKPKQEIVQIEKIQKINVIKRFNYSSSRIQIEHWSSLLQSKKHKEHLPQQEDTVFGSIALIENTSTIGIKKKGVSYD